MSAHTKGPWRAGTGRGGKVGAVVSDQLAAGALGGSDAVDYYGGNLIAESIAPENVPLIAAAPELLEALQDALACFLSDHWHDHPTANQWRAVIAKATGSAA